MKCLALASLFLPCICAVSQVQENGYLEIPIVGHFGDQVTARGVEEALQAAASMGIKHIVFTVDSKGGDQLAARDVYQALKKREKAFRYHAVVQEATGVALAVVVWCDTVFIRCGGSVGGVNLAIDETRFPGVETSVVLLNLALMAGEDARRHGRSPELVRAMIDPSEEVHVFRDPDGKIRFTRDHPSIPKDSMLLEHSPGKVLTLDSTLAAELGFAKAFDGDVEELGKELGLAGWDSKGDAGRRAMTQAAHAERLRVTTLKDDRRQFLIDQNRRRREATKAAIERFMNLANEWHPKLDTYSTYKDRGAIWDGYWDGWTHDTGRLTPEARRKWRDRTDITTAALSKARGGVLEMKELEREAKSLGQQLLYPEGRLDEIRVDLELKIAMLVRERDKRFKDDK